MNWEAMGAVGEIVSAVAVLITLGYLEIQVKMTNRLWAAQYQEQSREAMVSLTQPKIAEKEFAALVLKSRGTPNELDEVDLYRMKLVAQNEIIAYSQMYVRARMMRDERMMANVIRLSAGLLDSSLHRELLNSPTFDKDYVSAVKREIDA